MPWPWVILARVPRVVAGEASADGEGEEEVETDEQAEEAVDAEMEVVQADERAEAELDSEEEVEEDVQAEAAEQHDSEAEDEEDERAEEVDEAELDSEEEVEEDSQAESAEHDSEAEDEEDEQAEAEDEAELDSEEEAEEDSQAEDAEHDSDAEDEEDAQAEAVDEAELASDEEVEEDEANVEHRDGDEEHRADFAIPVALPPRITVMALAPTAHPVRDSPDMYPYVLGVGSGCILLNFGVQPFHGVCFGDRPYHYQSNLVMVRHFDCSGVEQGHPATATAERIPPRHGKYAVVANIESIGLISIGHGKTYFIAELMVHKGRGRAMLVSFDATSNRWQQETTQNPLPNDTNRDGEWVPSGVVSFRKILWWFDLSWGIISLDPFYELEEAPPLRFHRLPEGRALVKAPPNIHDHRCIAESQGGLRYVEIIVPEAEGGEAATVSMWSWIPAAAGNDETIAWDMEYAVSFAEIWEHDSYKATRLPRKAPVLVAVCPSDANLVYFALEERLFGVNVPERRVVQFVEDPYELVTPLWPAAPSCRYVLPWFLPLKVAQAIGMDPFAGSDAEQLQEEYDSLRENLTLENDVVEDEVEVDWDLLGPAVLEDLPEITDSELPVDESSEEEATLSMSMDPETLARLKAEVKNFVKDHEGSPSQDPGPGD